MQIKTAEILCVGTELLLGDIVNTNAAYLARELAALGIERVCRNMCEPAIRDAEQSVIEASYKTNTQAFVIKLAQSIQKYAELDDLVKLDALRGKVFYLYNNLGEKRACYLLAMLIRIFDECTDAKSQKVLGRLLAEAEDLQNKHKGGK